MDAAATREENIRGMYHDLLSREPDAAALRSWLQSPLTLEQIGLRIREAPEYIGKQLIDSGSGSGRANRRVLLFGAYGNGNLGDMVQADSLGVAIRREDPSAEIWASSVLPEVYPFVHGRQLPGALIRNAAVLNSFDAILIGGGGLLAHPHDPLSDDGWVRSIRVPVFLVGIGSSDHFAPRAQALIRAARYVSGRDLDSVSSLMAYRDDVDFLIDPVLGASDTSSFPAPQGRGICWVVRAPIEECHREIAEQMTEHDSVVAFEPPLEQELFAVFPGISMITSLEGFQEIARRHARIISMRYHGLIFGLKLGLPSYALRVFKANALLQMLGLPDCGANHIANLLPLPAYDMTRTKRQLAWLESQYALGLRRIVRRITTRPDIA